MAFTFKLEHPDGTPADPPTIRSAVPDWQIGNTIPRGPEKPGTILVDEQWNAKVRKFTPPKHGVVRTIALTESARDRLLRLPRESEFTFPTLRGTHYTPSARSPHWNRVRCSAGLGNVDLYVATRHYFGWYAWNVLELDARDIALHFGHQDGGELVRKLYGHPDAARARERIREAFRLAPTAPILLAASSTQHSGSRAFSERRAG